MDTISAFARRVGLTPSALRFYDDCGVLRPAHVDPDSGYRYYSPEQERDATLLRTLRKAELPLADITTVLTGTPAQARTVLATHARRLRARADAAQAAVETALRLVSGRAHVDSTVGGAELASAIRQVTPAVADSEEFPQLRCVLLECSASDLRLVATDRYRLTVRELVPHAVCGAPARAPVPADALVDAAPWALRHDAVRLIIEDTGAHLVAMDTASDEASDTVPLPTHDGDYPDYRALLDALEPFTCRVVTDRSALLEALTASRDPSYVPLHADGDTLHVGGVTVPAVCSRTARLAFDAAVLGPAVEAGVGPDVLLEITADDRPVVVRSADQGSFTTLVMPVRPR